MIGKLLAAPVRLLNVPARSVELLMSDTEQEKKDRFASAPLEAVAKAIEESVDSE